MRRLVSVFLISGFASFSAHAGREATIGEYTAEVKRAVAAKVAEALGSSHIEVEGTVTYADGEKFFLQKDDDGLKVLNSGWVPTTGSVVRVSGRPSLEGGRVVFVSERWSRTGEAALPEPKAADLPQLVGDPESSGPANWLRVTLRGRVIGETERGFALDVVGIPVNVMSKETPAFVHGGDITHPLVTATGVLELVLDQASLAGGGIYILGVKLNVQTAGDVALERDLAYELRRRDSYVRKAMFASLALLTLALLAGAVLFYRQRRRLFRSRTLMAERKRMADDIHDTIEQHLVGAKMLLALGRNKEAGDVLVRAKRELRDIVWGLKNDDMMRQSPAQMIRELAHAENAKGLYRVDVKVGEGLPAEMDAAKMRDLSLILREAIGNAVKHGGARKIAVSSDAREGGGWLVRVSNDGAAFDPDSAPGAAQGHFGLEGMRERARRLGATLAFARRRDGMVISLEAKA